MIFFSITLEGKSIALNWKLPLNYIHRPMNFFRGGADGKYFSVKLLSQIQSNIVSMA
jgi:hypothetical protein